MQQDHLRRVVRRLVRQHAGPVYEVRLSRAVWARSVGHLDSLRITAAKKLVQRALDALYDPHVIAVGTFKVFVGPEYDEKRWKGESHLMAAGAAESDLRRVFKKAHAKQGDFVIITEVSDLKAAIRRVISRDLKPWQPLYSSEPKLVEVKDADLEEFHDWLLGLTAEERTLRYGCDRYMNKLKKVQRIERYKVRKKHPWPKWLGPYQFGSHPMNCNCTRCCGPYPLN